MPEDLIPAAVEEPIETSVEEAPIESPEPATPTEPVEFQEGKEETPEGEPQPEAGAPEPLPKDVQRALRALRDDPANVTIARTLQNAYYKTKAYGEVFGTVEDARLAKATLDAMGGTEGVAGMRRDSETLESIDSRIEQGDPTVIDDAFESYPEGSARLIERGLSLMEQRNPEAFERMLRPLLLQSILSSGIADRLNYAVEFLNGGQNDMATRQLSSVVAFLNKLSEDAQAAKAAPPVMAPDATRAGIEQERMQLNVDRLAMQLGPYLKSSISTDISNLAGTRKLDAPAMDRLLQMVVSEIDSAVGQDTGYQANMNAYLRRGDVTGALNLAKASADRLRGQVVRSVWKELYGAEPVREAKPGGVQKAAKPAQRASSVDEGTPVRVANRPDGKYIDWDKTDQLLVIAGRAYLKDGRFVQWRVNQP